MFDVVAIPALAILVVVFLTCIWIFWLKDKDGRALNVVSEEDADDPSSHYD
jgi:hypothetical protein